MANGLKIADFGVHTVKGINLVASPGQCIGLTGPSGAGKTLLLRALADLDPHEGQMWLDNVAAETVPVHQWRRQVALLPAESAWWHDTVRPHFERIDNTWLTALGFGRQVLEWQVSRLSSGERQRLALLRMLMVKPRALLLDEPTANLDVDNAARVEHLLNSYRTAQQAVVIWVSHDLVQLRGNCSRIFTIQAGGLVDQEPPSHRDRET